MCVFLVETIEDLVTWFLCPSALLSFQITFVITFPSLYTCHHLSFHPLSLSNLFFQCTYSENDWPVMIK